MANVYEVAPGVNSPVGSVGGARASVSELARPTTETGPDISCHKIASGGLSSRRKAWLVNTTLSDRSPIEIRAGAVTEAELVARISKSNKACQCGSWSVVTWRKDGQGETSVKPFRCMSWRCIKCARAAAAIQFARMKTAFDRTPHDWSFLTFTMDPKRHRTRAAMYRAVSSSWQLFRKKLKWKFDYSAFVLCVELTETAKVPHIHAMLQSREVLAECARDVRKFHREWLKPWAMESGFGYKCAVEPARSTDACCGYFVKASGMAAELVGGAGKGSGQLPVDAPRHFRRIRTSKGFLPPKIKNDELTGAMAFLDTVTAGRRKRAIRARALRQRAGKQAPEGCYVDQATGEVIEQPTFGDLVERGA